MMSPARRAAFEILSRVETKGAYASVLLAGLDGQMREDDRALCHELVLGVLRRQLWLDRVLDHFAKRRFEKIDWQVKLALRIGLYQLRFLTRIPPSAAVNESVKLVRTAKLSSATSFVNAVLRRATREPDFDPAAGVIDADEKLAIESSHPTWLVRRWANAFGFEEAKALAHANNQVAPLAFRLTARALEDEDAEEKIIKVLEADGVRVSPSRIVPQSWRVDRYRTTRSSDSVRTRSGSDGIINSTLAFNTIAGEFVGTDAGEPQGGMPALLHQLSRDGLIHLQDEASQLVAHLLHAQPKHRVLDVCAAPGSKTTHIATVAPRTQIVAGDLHEHRLRTLRELARNQNAEHIELIAHDATKALPFADESFDRVLVDAPCSGTGTLRHNPEIRWRLTPSDIDELSRKQSKILANASAIVRATGRLVYSTCSVEPEENEQVVENFLNEHKDFRRALLDVPAELQTENGAVRTWPHRDDVDGFFIAAFEREN